MLVPLSVPSMNLNSAFPLTAHWAIRDSARHYLVVRQTGQVSVQTPSGRSFKKPPVSNECLDRPRGRGRWPKPLLLRIRLGERGSRPSVSPVRARVAAVS